MLPSVDSLTSSTTLSLPSSTASVTSQQSRALSEELRAHRELPASIPSESASHVTSSSASSSSLSSLRSNTDSRIVAHQFPNLYDAAVHMTVAPGCASFPLQQFLSLPNSDDPILSYWESQASSYCSRSLPETCIKIKDLLSTHIVSKKASTTVSLEAWQCFEQLFILSRDHQRLSPQELVNAIIIILYHIDDIQIFPTIWASIEKNILKNENFLGLDYTHVLSILLKTTIYCQDLELGMLVLQYLEQKFLDLSTPHSTSAKVKADTLTSIVISAKNPNVASKAWDLFLQYFINSNDHGGLTPKELNERLIRIARFSGHPELALHAWNFITQLIVQPIEHGGLNTEEYAKEISCIVSYTHSLQVAEEAWSCFHRHFAVVSDHAGLPLEQFADKLSLMGKYTSLSTSISYQIWQTFAQYL